MSSLHRKRKRRDKAQKRSVKFLTIFGAFTGAVAIAVVAVLAVASTWISDLPDYSKIDKYASTGVTTIYASDRETVLAKLYLENRIQVAKNEVSDYVLDGTVATEDERFLTHGGVDPIGIARALYVNIASGGASEGASTLTQQLVRNTVLLDEMQDRTIKRKVREMYIAIKIEEQYTKEQILMMYLNVVNYGDGCYGIEAASRDYFGKSADELTLSEAALLVGIPQSPTANNPRTNMDNALNRRKTVLDRMLRNGYITQKQYDKVIDRKPKIQKTNGRDDSISAIAPYFVDHVKTVLDNSGQFSTKELSSGGLNVFTTLDVSAQKAANESVEKYAARYGSSMDGSLVSINPSNGNVIAMVGGRDYENNKFNLATQMSRQAGSSFKTFTLLAALNAGVDPDNTYIDSSQGTIGKNWEVRNSEGKDNGDMSISDATTHSVNTVFARLCHGLGADKVVSMAQSCGITSNLEAYDSISLGAQGVNTLEMASAYATIANGGVQHSPVTITDIVDSTGETVYTHEYDEGTRVFSAAVAQKTTEILKTVVEYGTGTGAQLYSGQPAAGKTGTSEEGRDLWFCGYTPQLSTAVWCGYRSETPTSYYGGTIPAPIWREFTDTVLENQEIQEFPTTEEQITYQDSSNWNFSGYDDDSGYYGSSDYEGSSDYDDSSDYSYSTDYSEE